MVPTIILPDGREYVTVVSGQESSKKFGPSLDIEILCDNEKIKFQPSEGKKKNSYYVLAVAVWRPYTFVPGDLHEALLTGPTDS